MADSAGYVALSDWNGALSGRRMDVADTTLMMALHRSTAGGSGAFLARASDGERYWVKPLNNAQGSTVPITEQIVARAGRLIEAPVCDVVTAEIPPALVGWEFMHGKHLQQGIAHGSRALEPVTETRILERRSDDSNARRHLQLMGLHDWCWGGDGQWLMRIDRQYEFHSHDHGWFLPPEGPTWDVAQLTATVDQAHEFADAGDDVQTSAAEDMAAALERVTRGDLINVLSAIPQSWPVTDTQLEAVGFFLERRAPAVAVRLRARFR